MSSISAVVKKSDQVIDLGFLRVLFIPSFHLLVVADHANAFLPENVALFGRNLCFKLG